MELAKYSNSSADYIGLSKGEDHGIKSHALLHNIIAR